MRTSEEINEVAAALAEAQGALRPAVKDAVNPAYKSKYADLASVWEACREALPQFGLAVIQDVTNFDGDVSVTTRITHKSGQWIECGPLLVPMARPDAHGLGSAVSYGKRYALSAALGVVAEEDDDGNGATGNGTAPTREQRNAIADAAVERQGIVSGPAWDTKAATYDAGLIGVAKVGKNDADFETRQTPDGPRVAFSLTDGTRKIKAIALGDLAELLGAHRPAIEGQRVTAWGRIDDETYTAKPTKPGEKPFTNVYQVLTLTRLKVGDLDLSEPDRDDGPSEEEREEMADLAFPVTA